MRIFFITSKLNFRSAGGSIEELDLMMRTLQGMGSEVTAVTVFSDINDIPTPLPYPVIPEQIRSKRLFGIQFGVYAILRKYSREADIFHVDGHLMLYGAGLYRQLGGKVPVVSFFNRELVCWPEDTSDLLRKSKKSGTRFSLKRKLRWFVEKYLGMPLANGMDLFTFISPFYQAAYEDFGLRRDPRSFVIGDPIDFKKLMKENSITEHSYIQRNKKSGPVTLFFSSRMAPGKGFDFLLSGFSKVRQRERFRLILGGSGPEERLVHRMVRDLGLEPLVEFPGWVSKEELYRCYKTADIFVQAKWRPIGTSISLLYAMAFGLPSIVPAGGGLAWQAGESALCFIDGDADDLARKIEQLGADYTLRATLSRNCYKRIAEDSMNHQKQIRILLSKLTDMATSAR